jgi:hypothetical protein
MLDALALTLLPDHLKGDECCTLASGYSVVDQISFSLAGYRTPEIVCPSQMDSWQDSLGMIRLSYLCGRQ